LPAETVVVDTSNYYPQRDGTIDAIEAAVKILHLTGGS
jgi:8-hydroxy-5-deazaflavin:NADPH oxidoreductase